MAMSCDKSILLDEWLCIQYGIIAFEIVIFWVMTPCSTGDLSDLG